MTNKMMEKSQITTSNNSYDYYDINAVAAQLGKDISKLPFSLKVLLENLARNFDGDTIEQQDLENLIDSVQDANKRTEIAFSPSRVLMQDFTGVPAVVDLASMRDAVLAMNEDPNKINPLVPVDLVIDHSVQVDHYGTKESLQKNVAIEFKRNNERYQFLKWAQESFDNFSVVPPGTGICHQVNLENLAKVIFSKEENGQKLAYFDSVVGTDSHTTMINGLSVLGWGVGGIEAEAAMLGQPISMLIPEVIGFKLTGQLSQGITATDLVLTITNILREHGVVGKFVEFFGPALENLSLADRATISNMSPEFGATCAIFPIDQETLNYMQLTARDPENIELVEKYAKAQQLFVTDYNHEPEFSQVIELDLTSIKPSIAGPKRPQDIIELSQASSKFKDLITNSNQNKERSYLNDLNCSIGNGDIVIAAITSCTNTSNPSVMIAAGLVAKKAIEKGLKIKKYVKTSLAPGSQVVSEYLEQSGLQKYLDQLGFEIVGFGCTTCIGNSGPLHQSIEKTIKEKGYTVASVLSGNRNFEGRVHPLTKANYLASPPLVMAYALAGSMNIDLATESLGTDNKGKQVFLADIWPTQEEINAVISQTINNKMFSEKYSDLFKGTQLWQNIDVSASNTYDWQDDSTYIRLPSFFDNLNQQNAKEIKNAKILALFGDSITTDHISPAGNIANNSPAAQYLADKSVSQQDFNSYGSRRGNHEVMMRGTFANIRIKNLMLGGEKEGGLTKLSADGEEVSIYDAAIHHQEQGNPLVIFAGKEYGTGSSRDWAAKGTMLLGVKAVIAQSFERIHRSNLIGMGVMPLMFKSDDIASLKLTGYESVDITGIDENITPKQEFTAKITYQDGSNKEITLISRLDTSNEVEYYKSGGILQYVLTKQIG